MAEFNETGDRSMPFEAHPLYQEAMQKARDGDQEGAVAAPQRLIQRYPEEQFIRDLLLRFQLRTTFSGDDHISAEHTQGTPVLRTMVLLLLAVTTCLVLITAGIAAYNRIYLPRVSAQEQEAVIATLWEDVARRMDAGDLSGSRTILEELYNRTPNDDRIQEQLQIINQRQAWADLYADAMTRKERGDWQLALDLLVQIPTQSPEYARAQRVIKELQGVAALEAAWQDAQNLIQVEDWQAAVSTLAWIRAQSSSFRRTEVEELLYQIQVRLAQQLISEADGNVELLRQAIGHLGEALSLRPTDQDLIEEKRLAVGFVAGSDALDRGDWVAVVARWEPVYTTQPDYQGSMLERRLFEAYPLAARQLISQSKGSERMLYQALGYLDQALSVQPEDEALLEERRLLTEYLKGLEAFREENWDLAIAHWGPISLISPEYLGGVLEEKLGLACANSLSPDEALCLP